MSTCIELINFNLLAWSRAGRACDSSPVAVVHGLTLPGSVDRIELSVGRALEGASLPWCALVGLYSSTNASDDLARNLELYVARSGRLPPGAVRSQELAVDGWGSFCVDLDPRWAFSASWALVVRMEADLAQLSERSADRVSDFRVTAHLSYAGGGR